MAVTGTVKSQDGTSIGYEKSGEGPALVLVDAAACFRGSGPSVEWAAALAADFTVFAYDRRGRGESTDTEPYAVQREVEDLAALIEAAGGEAYVHGFSSGAVLALHAAASGLPIPKLTLLEPPLALDEPSSDESSGEPDLAAEIDELVAAGRREDAVLHFNQSIGVPEQLIAGMRQQQSWPALVAAAHTLAYDLRISGSLPAERLATITTPTLVIDSTGSDERLHRWADGVAAALPRGERRTLAGEWHGVPAEDLAAALRDFLTA